jgi:hypothetical protein
MHGETVKHFAIYVSISHTCHYRSAPYVTGYTLPDMAEVLSFLTLETTLKFIHHFIH